MTLREGILARQLWFEYYNIFFLQLNRNTRIFFLINLKFLLKFVKAEIKTQFQLNLA